MKLFYSTVFTFLITSLSSLNSNAQVTNKSLSGKQPVTASTTNAFVASSAQPKCSNTEHASPYPIWMADNEMMAGNLKAFQENKGQFVNMLNDWTVSYGVDYGGGNQVLLTSKGLIYYVSEKVEMTEEEADQWEKGKTEAQKEQEEKVEKHYKTVYHKVSMEWENANANPTIEALDKTPYYFGSINPQPSKTAKSINNIQGFKELIYHDVYPGIDVIFTFHPETGIKYTVRVKPGYDASVFKMKYSGQDKLVIDPRGNLHIKTHQGDILDHAPATTQSSRKVASAFNKISDDEIGFKLGQVNNSSEIIIDPWVTTPLVGGHFPADCGVDNADNVYVLEWTGGAMYMQKYNSGGGLVWTYSMTQYGIQSSNSDMAVDPATGTTYTTQPYYFFNISGGSYSLLSLTTGGTLNYFYNTYPSSNIFETWGTGYSCQTGVVTESGSPAVVQSQVGIANSANGNLLGPIYINTNISELYAASIGPNGNLYCISSNSCFCVSGVAAFTNTLCAFNITGVTPVPLWNTVIPTYNYADFSFKNAAGIPDNGVAEGCNYVYTSDGANVYQFDINTGAVVGNAPIPGGSNVLGKMNSGIAVDPICGYVYVGNQSTVQVYTGSLVPVTTYTTPGTVSDVSFDNGIVTAIGETSSSPNSFVAQFAGQTCPVPVTMTFTATPCALNSGSATATPTFCTGPYTYLWSPGGQTTQTATGLSAGTYTVTVGMASGCNSATLTDTVTIPKSGPSFTVTKAATASLCTGSTGTATVTVAGGTPPYTYLWSNGNTTSNNTGLSSGTYCVTITDNIGCSDTVCVNVPNAGGLTATIKVIKNVSCFGGSDGSLAGVPSGGTSPYTFSWSNGQTVDTATGLAVGNYTLTVTDVNGCKTSVMQSITQPKQLRDSITATTNLLCSYSTNGTATVGVAGGIKPYTYSWNSFPTQTNVSATGLSAGSYTVTVTDSNGCTNTAVATITAPAALTVATSTIPSACIGNTGSATATPAGGTGAYTYFWSNANTNATDPNLSSGTYTITVTDKNGCQVTATAVVGNVGGETDTIVDVVNVKCWNGKTASATDSAIGGTPAYTYSWAPGGQTNRTATGLSAGTYTVTTKDSRGCVATAKITITQPAQLRDSIIKIRPVTCAGATNGSATVGVKGGTAPYTFTWAPSGGTADSGTGLGVGTYTVTVKDANGCTVSASATITAPSALALAVAGFPTTCFDGIDGQATVIPAGGITPYTYSWSPGGQTNANIDDLSAGIYTITVTDASGCTATATASVTQPPAIAVAFDSDTLHGCGPLCVNFSDMSVDPIPGDTIKHWYWSFGDSAHDTNQNPKHCFVGPGTYSIKLSVTSKRGCGNTFTIANMITVFNNPMPDFIVSPQPTTIFQPNIQFTDQSTDKYGIVSWVWNFEDPLNDTGSTLQNPMHKYGDTGIYCPQLTVTNVHGCKDSITHCLIISPQYTLYIPDAFTPNHDGRDDIFLPRGEYISTYDMYIFDRWGMKLFHSTSLDQGWDGTVSGRICQEDTYVYLINVTDNLGKKHSYIGKVTLIK